MKRKTYLILAIGIVGLISLSAVAAITPATTSSDDIGSSWWWGGDDDTTNNLPYSNLEPGDWVILGTSGTFFDFIIPGDYGHSVMFCGYVQSGQYIWDRDAHEWMAAGTPYVIHSTKSSEAGNGLGYSKFTTAVNDHAEFARSLEVSYLASWQKDDAVYFLKNELDGGWDGYPVGPKYDWGWTCKQVDADEPNGLSGVRGYYCSEAVWAAYKGTYGIDLDPDGDSWSWSTAYGVSPDDLMNDGDSTTIQYDD
ncbi:MAG: hypothetical protein EU547_05350 [Promethearchaeota archaeon]|nr:MAG: hypothetical protein EU547_05350 [Candidatus Lokiarchaeota archaeon]